MSDATLFDEQPELLHGDPVSVIATCGWCGATSDPIPLTESGDPGDPWTGANIWGYLTLKSHESECVERPGRAP